MNLDHLQSIALVQKLAWTLKDAKFDGTSVEVAVFPPFTDLRSVQTLIDAERFTLAFGGQDLSPKDSGAYTGDISGAFLKALDCTYVLIGHSERRQGHGETDEIVNAKVLAAVKHGLVPVICVGETEEELEQHGTSAVPVAQTKAALAGVPVGHPGRHRVRAGLGDRHRQDRDARDRAGGRAPPSVRPSPRRCPRTTPPPPGSSTAVP